MNLKPSNPRRVFHPLGQILIGGALFLLLGTAASAERFYLSSEKEHVRYGPFEFQDGSKVDLAGQTYAIQKEPPPGGGELEKKLQSIILPEINLSKAKVEIVVQYLQQRSIELDPAKKGVNLILKLDGKPADQLPEITFSGKQVSLLDALKVLTQVAGMTYRFDGRLVFIEP